MRVLEERLRVRLLARTTRNVSTTDAGERLLARRRIRAGGEAEPDREAEWVELLPLIGEFWRRVLPKVEARHAPGRLKQWLGMLRRNFPRAEILYAELRAQKDPLVVAHILGCHGVPVLKAAA